MWSARITYYQNWHLCERDLIRVLAPSSSTIRQIFQRVWRWLSPDAVRVWWSVSDVVSGVISVRILLCRGAVLPAHLWGPPSDAVRASVLSSVRRRCWRLLTIQCCRRLKVWAFLFLNWEICGYYFGLWGVFEIIRVFS